MPWTALALSSAAVVVVTGFLVLWALPLLLTRAPSDGLSTAQRLSAVNDVRATLVTFLIAVGAVGSLVFTARTFLLSRETQVTDRYTRAVSQIGDSSLEVRIGGIYALERIGKDSAPDRPTIVYVLARSSGIGPKRRARPIRNPLRVSTQPYALSAVWLP